MTDMWPLVALCSTQPSWPQAFAAGVYGSDFLSSFVQTVVCFHPYCCGPNVIHHFFCDMPQIIPLSCSDPFISQLVLFLAALFVGFGSFFVMSSLQFLSWKSPRPKAASRPSRPVAPTWRQWLCSMALCSLCTCHSSQHSTKQDKVLSVVYAFLIPMLNPLIYSLRNTEIKGVLKRMMKKVAHLPQKE